MKLFLLPCGRLQPGNEKVGLPARSMPICSGQPSMCNARKWDQPKLLDENLIINSGDEDGAATLSSTGEQMIFTRARYDKTEALGAELYSSSQSRGSWSEPIKLQVVGDSLSAAHPALSHDGSVLYFVSDMPGGFGGKDIWMAEKDGGSFTNPVNLGEEINTPGDEMFPFIRDNGELYFSSNYHMGMGGFDIFKAVKMKIKRGVLRIWDTQ
jgi:peptidoglycan-associated lipoprotein